MFNRTTLIVLAVALAAAASGASAHSADYSLTVYSAAAPGSISTERLADYGDRLPGYALVRDKRRMNLERGASELRFTDVAKRIDPTTVSFNSLTDPDGTRVIEQNYQFDLVSGDKLLERYLGQTVTVEQSRGDTLQETTGELLSASGGLTLRLASGQVATFNSWSGIRFPSLPGGLIVKPTLLWLVDAERGGDHDVRVSYQARGMTWWTDYNAVLDESAGCRLDMTAWVTLVNQSGAGFADTRLKLVAGEVNRAPVPAPKAADMRVQRMEMASQAQEGFAESSLFEYHLYTLGRRTDLPDNDALLESSIGMIRSKKPNFQLARQRLAAFRQPGIDPGIQGPERAIEQKLITSQQRAAQTAAAVAHPERLEEALHQESGSERVAGPLPIAHGHRHRVQAAVEDVADAFEAPVQRFGHRLADQLCLQLVIGKQREFVHPARHWRIGPRGEYVGEGLLPALLVADQLARQHGVDRGRPDLDALSRGVELARETEQLDERLAGLAGAQRMELAGIGLVEIGGPAKYEPGAPIGPDTRFDQVRDARKHCAFGFLKAAEPR